MANLQTLPPGETSIFKIVAKIREIISFGTSSGSSNAREVLTANTTYYVNGSTGSDTLNDGTSGAPFATVQKGIDAACAVDGSTFDVTVQVIAGTYTTSGVPVARLKSFLGAGVFTLKGDTTTPSNVVLTATSPVVNGGTAGTIFIENCAWSVAGFKLTTVTGGHTICVQNGAGLTISGNMEFGTAAGSGSHIRCTLNSRVAFGTTAYSITGNAGIHYDLDSNSTFYSLSGCTVTLTGTPAFSSYFAFCSTSAADVFAPTFSGGATGTRYLVNLNGVINTFGGGANYFPGNVAGSAATGGQYV